ncbi:MAG: hypothetical protein CMO33_06850 [Verrucomicrobia bacterium]|nr:hypothetical protein [Verrucomicrobiota bacterium]
MILKFHAGFSKWFETMSEPHYVTSKFYPRKGSTNKELFLHNPADFSKSRIQSPIPTHLIYLLFLWPK